MSQIIKGLSTVGRTCESMTHIYETKTKKNKTAVVWSPQAQEEEIKVGAYKLKHDCHPLIHVLPIPKYRQRCTVISLSLLTGRSHIQKRNNNHVEPTRGSLVTKKSGDAVIHFEWSPRLSAGPIQMDLFPFFFSLTLCQLGPIACNADQATDSFANPGPPPYFLLLPQPLPLLTESSSRLSGLPSSDS